MVSGKLVPQFFSYAFFLISQMVLFLIVRTADFGSANPVYLFVAFSFFAVSMWISVWTGDFRLAFFSLMIWFCIGFLQFVSFSSSVEQGVSIAKWGTLFSLVVLTTFVHFFRHPLKIYRHTGAVVGSLFALILYLMVSSTLGTYPLVSLLRWAGFLAMAFFAFYLLPHQLEPDDALMKFYATLWFTSNLIVLLSLLSWVEILPNYDYFPNRFQGFFGNPNGLGPWLNMAAMVNLYFLSGRNSVVKLLSSLFLVLAVFLLFHCNSRANYLGLAVGVAVLLLFSKRKWLLLIFVLLVAGFVSSYQTYYGRGITEFDWREHLRLESRHGVTTGRVEKWELSVESTEEQPWYGAGLGAKDSMFEERFGSLTEYGRSRVLFDNSYLNFLYETGYPGLCLFMVWLIGSLFCVFRNCVKRVEGPFQSLSQLSFALVLNIATLCIFESFLGTVGNITSLVLWVTLGLASVKTSRAAPAV